MQAFDQAPDPLSPLLRGLSHDIKASLTKWCSQLCLAVFRCRASFSAFVRHAITLPRANVSSVSPAFPLPIPHCGVFARMPHGLSSQRRAKVLLRRALVVIVLALNFWWSGGRFIEDKFLERVPSPSQRKIFERIRTLLQVDGPSEDFALSKSGRRMPQLIARLAELSEATTNLAAGAHAYDKTFEGRNVPADNTVQEQLEPYRSLNSDRLVLHGTGHWDPTEHMSDLLAVPFRNPDVLLFERDLDQVPMPKITDPVPELAKLARLWDSKGLLFIHAFDIGSLCPHEYVKIFNCWKSQEADRQIGDRRGRNAVESKLEGPSCNLPTGFDLLDIAVSLPHQRVSISVTDRRDFYHQFKCSMTRAISNTLGPGIPAKLLEDTTAFSQFLFRDAMKKHDRLASGDDLGGISGRFPRRRWDKESNLHMSFASILQGDHGGVEYACDAHVAYLQSVGLLAPSSRVVADRPFLGDELMEGLVIDDYFAIAVTDRPSVNQPSRDVACFNAAREAYESQGILGSPAKDVIGSSNAKVVGAQVNSSPTAVDRGIVTIGSPPEKRFGLSWITLMLCQLPFTTDVLHVCVLGAWVSVLMYRRPLMSLLNKAFKLVDAAEVDASFPKLVALPRSVATELTLLAILVPFAVTDLAAEFCSEVFCTDASLEKGAICSACIPPRHARLLWSGLRSKGAFHRMKTPAEALSKRLSMHEELPDLPSASNSRPLAFHYDFIEVFAGASVVTAAAVSIGLCVGPPVDLSASPEFNMEWVHVISWLTFLVSSGRVLSFMVSPPCTTFSLMRRPALRSKSLPHGFDPSCALTHNGNLLAHRGLQLLKIGHLNATPGLFETPFGALTRFLPGYKSFLGKPHVAMERCDSCMYGSIHLKSFRFLSVHLSLEKLRRRCDGSHSHVTVQGSYTKDSATYVPELAHAIASAFKEAVEARRALDKSQSSLNVHGHESQLVNSIALSAEWKVDSVWTYRKPCHINILEMTALCKLAERLARRSQSLRVSALMDSFVCSEASSKGRTSSLGLAPPLRRFCAISVACSLYFCTPFVPTRLNASDDPTRDAPIRPPSGSFDLTSWSTEDLSLLLGLPRLRRWASNWVRLVLSLSGPSILLIRDRSIYRQTCGLDVPRSAALVPLLDFDSSLGYPGEGPWLDCRPRLRSSVVVCCLVWLLLCLVPCGLPVYPCLLLSLPKCSSVGRVLSVAAMASESVLVEGALAPRNAADVGRADARAIRPELLPGRPVLPVTTLNREALFSAFLGWCRSIQVDFENLLLHAMQNLDEINAVLSRYGRDLYGSGRPYGHYAETINAVSARRPAIRRHLQQCWDLAYAWMQQEPPRHHTAMPFQVLLACLSTALLWGWPRFAGILALTWGGVLRIGESLKAQRRHLLLPQDFDSGSTVALLSIVEAKTRFSAARHQTAKVDIPDLVRVISLAFGALTPECFLWPYSGSTLRARFRTVMKSLLLPVHASADLRPLDLGSLRSGGATWILSVTEDGELVRRRGRWLTQRIMEIYLQETSAIRFVMSLSGDQKYVVLNLAHSFISILQRCEIFVHSKIPMTTWYFLFSHFQCA